MFDISKFVESPDFFLTLLAGIAWAIRLESKSKTNEKDILEIKLDLKDHKKSASERSEMIYGKFDQLQKDINKIDSSLARIEGKLEHFKDE